MDFLQILVLSLVQGLTEFLPVSSSAHLILPDKILGWSDQGIVFDVACHLGTLFAVLIYFRSELLVMTKSPFEYISTKKVTHELVLACYIILGTIPVCIVGYLIDKFLLDHLREHAVIVISITTILFAILLWFSDQYAVKNKNDLTTESMGIKKAMIIAISQIFALIPGTSRSGISITTALFMGLNRKSAAKYSFLLSIPLILAASTLSLLKIFKDENLTVDVTALGLGILISFVSAYIVIKCFMKWIERMGMTPFVIYRLILGVILLFVYFCF